MTVHNFPSSILFKDEAEQGNSRAIRRIGISNGFREAAETVKVFRKFSQKLLRVLQVIDP